MYQEINAEYLAVPLSLHEEATRKLVNTRLNLWKTIPSVSECKPSASGEKKHPKEEFFCVWLQSNQASPAPSGKLTWIKVVLHVPFPRAVTRPRALSRPCPRGHCLGTHPPDRGIFAQTSPCSGPGWADPRARLERGAMLGGGRQRSAQAAISNSDI